MATAFLGPRGSFSEEAALLRAETDQLVAFSSFPALVSAVETGLADEAVLPIENSIEGAVSTTLDLLIHETALRIAGEPGVARAPFPGHATRGSPGGCPRRHLAPTGARSVPAFSRSLLAGCRAGGRALHLGRGQRRGGRRRRPSGWNRHGARRALYGGDPRSRYQDVHTNVTRFVVLAREDAPPTGNDKTSLAFRVRENVPGALHAILASSPSRTCR